MVEQLKEMKNNVEIVGVLKTKDLEDGTSEKKLKDGTTVTQNFIRGSLVVEFTDKQGNINNVRSQVWVGDTKNDGGLNKMYKSYKTIMDEYKDKDNFGEEADTIQVTGDIQSNDYISASGTQVSNNRIRTRFANRLENKNVEGHAWATIEAYVDSYVDEMNADGEPTGRKAVTMYTVSYGGKVQQLQRVFVPEVLAEGFETTYQPGSTGEVTLSIKHFVSVEEVQDVEPVESLGFGTVQEVAAADNYTDELWLTGGKIPYDEPKALSVEQIALLKKTRKEALASLDDNVSKSQPQVGFGNAKPSGKPEESANSDNPFKNSSANDPIEF